MKIFDLARPYNKIDFINYLNNTFLPDFALEERSINLDNTSIFTNMNYLGTSKDCEIAVFEAVCPEKDSNKRITITQNAFRVLRQHGIANALVAFTYGTEQWRLSLLTSKLELKDDKIISKYSSPRRYSYLLGGDSKTHTPYKYLIEKGGVSSLDELMQRFSVEVVNKQFYDEIAKHFTQLVGGERGGENYPGLLNLYGTTKPSVKYQEFAVRLIGRIMFCWFLKEKKSFENIPLIPEKLLSQNAVKENSDYYHSILEPLFFELLNTRQNRRKGIFKQSDYNQIPYLNGGLFSPQTDDYYKFSGAINGGVPGIASIPDEWFITLFEVLERYSFTVDENTAYDVELSIDPEMLGRIFENLLAEINPETGESAKKRTGSFYTPRDIVDYMVDASLFHYLKDKTGIDDTKINAIISYGKDDDEEFPFSKDERIKMVDAISSLTVLDPACGSGAFPIGILQKVVYILQQVDENSKLWVDKQYSSVTSTELRQEIKLKQEKGLFDYIRKLGVIRESIFGVDIQTIATEIAKLRCFLSLIVEEIVEDDEPNRGIQPLPNLDFKFIAADSLVKMEDSSEQLGQLNLFEDHTHIDELKSIRNEYFTADSEDRIEIKSEFKDIQKAMLMKTINNYAKQASNRYKLLSEWNPFENKSTTWFDPEWMFGTKEFDIVIANPPYIHLEHIKDKSQYYKSLGYCTYEARGDIYALFYEKGVNLLKQNGFLCYITSNKWMRAEYGKSLRRFFSSFTNPIELIDFAGQQIFDATVDTNILLLSKSENQLSTSAVSVKDKDSIANLSVYIKKNGVKNCFSNSESWTILSPIEQGIKSKIEEMGTPLKDWNIRINLGIKTGCNEAFIIDGTKRAELISKDPKCDEIIRPILRGRDIKRYGYEFADMFLITAHNGYTNEKEKKLEHINIKKYPAIKTHLDEYFDAISNRADKGVTPYNLRNCAYMGDFTKPKIIWGEISDKPKFALENGKYYQEATTFIMIGTNLEYLLAFLNSTLSEYFFAQIGTTTGVGTVRWKKFKLEAFPIPKPIHKSEPSITALVQKLITASSLEKYSEIESEIDKMVFNAYGFTIDEIKYIQEYIKHSN
jgi:type I restriction-modification system DNA methylase subunit